jgi:predicted nucleic acid-binding protein
MTIVVDTSVLIDHLRGVDGARDSLRNAAKAGERLVASVMTKIEVLIPPLIRREPVLPQHQHPIPLAHDHRDRVAVSAARVQPCTGSSGQEGLLPS